jgi:hypothetical protein
VLVRACVPGFALGLAVAAVAAGAVAALPGIGGLLVAALGSAIVVLTGLYALHRHEPGMGAAPAVVAGAA